MNRPTSPFRLLSGILLEQQFSLTTNKPAALTTSCFVIWVGVNPVQVELSVDTDQRWWLNKIEPPALKGCIDVDLNFSPSTDRHRGNHRRVNTLLSVRITDESYARLLSRGLPLPASRTLASSEKLPFLVVS